jgi:hypothetical protein
VAMVLNWTGVPDWRPLQSRQHQDASPTTSGPLPLPSPSPKTRTRGASTGVPVAPVIKHASSSKPRLSVSVPAQLPNVEPTKLMSASGSEKYYLASLSPVETEIEGRPGQCTGGCTGFHGGPARIQTIVYPNSFITRLDGNGRRSVSTWNSLRECSTFSGTVGLANDSDTTQVSFSVSLDGGEDKVLATINTGDSNHFSISVKNVNRFTLAAFVSGSDADNVVAVWGNAALTCKAGTLSELDQ